MDTKIIARLDGMVARKKEITEALTEQATLNDPNILRKLSKELSSLEKVLKHYSDYQKQRQSADEAQELSVGEDAEMCQLAQQEFKESSQRCVELEQILKSKMLLNEDVDTDKNVYIEIRAGTGGDESSLFAADLLRMYTRYAERRQWKSQLVSGHSTAVGGYKTAVTRIEGSHVYGALRFESGVHRVQRVPETESQGRIHTSACTVAILQEPDEMEVPEIDKSDLRVDTYRASGAGGQHINKTDSAVRITHLPTGISVECQQERSQLQNRLRAMAFLQTHLLDKLKQEREEAISTKRRNLIGSGERSEKIRTYNFPQGRVTDHRVNLTLHKLQEILDGDLNHLVEVFQKQYEEQLLSDPSPK